VTAGGEFRRPHMIVLQDPAACFCTARSTPAALMIDEV
jgi:hypothetical protein